MWLYTYESTRQGYNVFAHLDFVNHDKFFGPPLTRNVGFLAIEERALDVCFSHPKDVRRAAIDIRLCLNDDTSCTFYNYLLIVLNSEGGYVPISASANDQMTVGNQ